MVGSPGRGLGWEEGVSNSLYRISSKNSACTTTRLCCDWTFDFRFQRLRDSFCVFLGWSIPSYFGLNLAIILVCFRLYSWYAGSKLGSNLLWHTGFASRGSRLWSWCRVRMDLVGMLPPQAQFSLTTWLSRGLQVHVTCSYICTQQYWMALIVYALLCINPFKSK